MIFNKTFILIGFLLFLLVLMVIVLISKQQPVEKSVVRVNKIIAVSMPKDSLLPSGQKAVFTITFQIPVKADNLNVLFTKKGGSDESRQKVQFDLGSKDTDLKLTTKEDIEDLTTYYLVILDKQGNLLLDNIYYSQSYSPTPAPSNNLQLKNFLPYHTSTFSLEYLENRNVYIFHLKPDLKSSDSPEVQFNKARVEATQFIQNKSVDLNSIVIEWRYY